MLLVSVLISACCVDKWDIVLQNVPTKGNRHHSHLENAHLVPMLWVVQCSIPIVMVQTVEEIEQDQDEEDIEDFVAFSIKSLQGFAILDGGADRYEDTTIETTDVGFTFACGETEAAKTKICFPHAEFPQGISVNVVSNVSTPCLIGLDVLREYGLIIDYHHNRVYSHILKRHLPCAILPTRHLALEMLLSNSEQGQHPVPSHALSTRHWGLHSGAQEKKTPSFESTIFQLHDEKSEHEHGHTSTSEDDLLSALKTGLASTRERKPSGPRHPRDLRGRMLLHELRSMTKPVTS